MLDANASSPSQSLPDFDALCMPESVNGDIFQVSFGEIFLDGFNTSTSANSSHLSGNELAALFAGSMHVLP